MPRTPVPARGRARGLGAALARGLDTQVTRALAVAAIAFSATLAGTIPGRAATTTTTTTSTTAGTGNAPSLSLTRIAKVQGATALAVRPGDRALYVALQPGRVVRLRAGHAPETVLDLTNRVRDAGEQGLLGLAFAPDGKHLYVHYSGATSGETELDEYAVARGRPDPATRRSLLTVPQPQVNHNGGQLVFGPDGMLYLGLGDGGNRDDEGPGHVAGGNAQSRDTLLGKILRIDPTPAGSAPYTIPADNPFVNGGGRPEIYLYGLRNPWRFSFDTATGDLWIADVGQDAYEEVDRLPAGSIAGANLGWPNYEGMHRYRGAALPGVVMPQIETNHRDGNCSITGGYVSRGARVPALQGWYLYSDYCNGAIEAARIDGNDVQTRSLGVQLPEISSFGQDAQGTLYVLSQSSGVYRVDPS